MTKSRESWVPYPVSDEIDDETGLPIQPERENLKENTRKMIALAILSDED